MDGCELMHNITTMNGHCKNKKWNNGECECVHKMCEDISISERFSADNLEARGTSVAWVFFRHSSMHIPDHSPFVSLFGCALLCSVLTHGHRTRNTNHHRPSHSRSTHSTHSAAAALMLCMTVRLAFYFCYYADCWCWIAIKQSYGIFL